MARNCLPSGLDGPNKPGQSNIRPSNSFYAVHGEFSKNLTNKKCSNGASHEVALEIVKAKKPFSDVVVIKMCAIDMASWSQTTEDLLNVSVLSVMEPEL